MIDKVREAYPGTLPSHLSIAVVPQDIVHSGLQINMGNPEHLRVSQHLSQNLNIPLTYKLVNMILASYGHVIITIFEGDDSIMVFVPKLSTIRYEPLSLMVIDANGNVIRLASGGDLINGGGGHDGYAGGYANNGQIVYRCASWITITGTAADGTYCETYYLQW